MFVAWREIKFARSRFVLIGTVVTLLTVLVSFLSGLAAGLANQSVSAITSIGADRIVFSTPSPGTALTYADSAVAEDAAKTWAHRDGVVSVNPVGISQAAIAAGTRKQRVSIFGTLPQFDTAAPVEDGHVTVPQTTAKALAVEAGDTVTLAGAQFHLDSVTDDSWYTHTPVVHTTPADWRRIASATGSPGAYATVLAVTSNGTDFAAADAAAGTSSTGVIQSLTALSSFRSELGSLLLILAMLFGISTILVCAFFAVWGIQRRPDVAVLKALGASNRMLLVDALGQAAIVLILGVGIGVGLSAALGAAVCTTVPFIFNPLTTLLPGAAMVVLGLVGAAAALRSVITVDPLTALGSGK